MIGQTGDWQQATPTGDCGANQVTSHQLTQTLAVSRVARIIDPMIERTCSAALLVGLVLTSACERSHVQGETPYAARFVSQKPAYVRTATANVARDSTVKETFADPQYTAAQAVAGATVYSATCARCHANDQWKGGTFAATWRDRRLSDFYDLVSVTMPQDNPGGLTAQQYVDVTAYVLQLAGFASGDVPLRADTTMLRHARLAIKDSTQQPPPPRASRGS